MRVSVSWLATLLPGLTATADELAAALVRVGLEVEQIERIGHEITGVVVGQVLDIEELTEFKKPLLYCHVDVGSRVHEVVCGATNFRSGDRVAFATPGAELSGGFRIARRQTYGRTSDGMICSAAELGISAESDGILVLDQQTPLGSDVALLLGLRDEVLDIAVTPDRGYALSMRGMARETATALGLELQDPAAVQFDPPAGDGPLVRLDDPGCDRYVARVVTALDSSATSPAWLQRRLVLAGMRPVSLAVDVTNHVMLELGQPLHAFDLDRLQGTIHVRRAASGERLTTLDGQDRALHESDLVIADDSGAIALAGVMGGAATEVTAETTSLLLESAHFAPGSVARTARRHKLPSEASRRFERGVDPQVAGAAGEVAVRMLVELGGVTVGPGTDVHVPVPIPALRLPVDQPGRVAGRHYAPDVVRRRLEDVGCTVTGEADRTDGVLVVVAPSWRPDLTGAAELVEEVVRLEGYDTIPVVLPVAPAGQGLTAGQRLRRTASRALAAAGLVEVTTAPFVSDELLATLGQAQPAPRLQNPLSEAESLLRPLLLPGVLGALLRSTGRGLADLALYEVGLVFQGTGAQVAPPPVTARPSDEDLARLDAALPAQPRHAALALAGQWNGRAADAADAVEAVVILGRALGLALRLRPAQVLPWHPGRCVEVLLGERVLGHAGELHPRVVADLGLPVRTCAAEVDLDALVDAAAAEGPAAAPVVSGYPPATVDVALVVDNDVPAAEVGEALRDGAGPLLEDLRLFDLYTGPQVGQGRRSLAWALRLRAADRTLTDVEVLAARDAAVAEAGRRTGAVLRGT